MSLQEVCSSFARVNEAATQQVERELRRIAQEAAERDPSDLVGMGITRADESRAYATYEERLSKLYAGLWPKVDDPDLKSILRDLSRDVYDEAAQNAFAGMCT